MRNGVELERIMEIAVTAVIVGVAVAGAIWQYRVLSRAARGAAERRARGEPEPRTAGKRVFILICAAGLIALSLWLMRP